MSEDRSLRNRAVIVGIGNTDYTSHSGRSELRLALEACQAAIADAGLPQQQVDGLVRYGASQTGVSEQWLASNLGLADVRYWGAVDYGGSASAAIVAHAATAVACGMANYVLCYRSVNGRSGLRPGTSDTYERLLRGADPNYDNFLVPYGMTAPVELFGLLANRHMEEFGTTREQLGAVATTIRANANRYPDAQMHERSLTLDEYLAAPLISDPLGKFDCCLQTDGAAAVLVTTPERAADLSGDPVYIAGAVQATLPDGQGPLHSLLARPDLLETPGAVAARRLYGQSGIGPHDVDVAQLYDCFTITVLLQLEAYGFCQKGEPGAFVEERHTAPEGDLPINTDGGNLSAGYIHGMTHVLEGVRQMRGTSTTQIADASTCLVTAGLPVPTSALMLTRDEF